MHNPTGLHERLNAVRTQREHDAIVENDDRKDPSENHQARLRREQCDRDIATLRHELEECVIIRNSMCDLLRTLSRHTHSSRHLSLAITNLENSLLRLETHLGTAPKA